jgi:hypothetical protein
MLHNKMVNLWFWANFVWNKCYLERKLFRTNFVWNKHCLEQMFKCCFKQKFVEQMLFRTKLVRNKHCLVQMSFRTNKYKCHLGKMSFRTQVTVPFKFQVLMHKSSSLPWTCVTAITSYYSATVLGKLSTLISHYRCA